jgi:hypothetical protein
VIALRGPRFARRASARAKHARKHALITAEPRAAKNIFFAREKMLAFFFFVCYTN